MRKKETKKEQTEEIKCKIPTEVLSNINDNSVRYCHKYLFGQNLVEVIEKESSYHMVMELDGKYKVYSLMKKNNKQKPCYEGSLGHYCHILARQEKGWKDSCIDEVYARELEIENEFIRKYNLPKNYFWFLDN